MKEAWSAYLEQLAILQDSAKHSQDVFSLWVLIGGWVVKSKQAQIITYLVLIDGPLYWKKNDGIDSLLKRSESENHCLEFEIKCRSSASILFVLITLLQ